MKVFYLLRLCGRLIRNLVIAVASSVWLVPLWIYCNTLIRWIADLDSRLPKGSNASDKYAVWPGLSDVSRLYVCERALRDGIMALGIIVIFWVLIVANKFWPLKDKQYVQPAQKDKV